MLRISRFGGFCRKPQISRCHFWLSLVFVAKQMRYEYERKTTHHHFPNTPLFLVFVFKSTEDVLLLHQRVALCPGIFGPFAVGGLFSQSGSLDGWKTQRTGATLSRNEHLKCRVFSFFLTQQEAILQTKNTPTGKIYVEIRLMSWGLAGIVLYNRQGVLELAAFRWMKDESQFSNRQDRWGFSPSLGYPQKKT